MLKGKKVPSLRPVVFVWFPSSGGCRNEVLFDLLPGLRPCDAMTLGKFKSRTFSRPRLATRKTSTSVKDMKTSSQNLWPFCDVFRRCLSQMICAISTSHFIPRGPPWSRVWDCHIQNGRIVSELDACQRVVPRPPAQLSKFPWPTARHVTENHFTRHHET